jgi:hypothetical protein
MGIGLGSRAEPLTPHPGSPVGGDKDNFAELSRSSNQPKIPITLGRIGNRQSTEEPAIQG